VMPRSAGTSLAGPVASSPGDRRSRCPGSANPCLTVSPRWR
jgi:hypothetical protein